MIWMTVVLRISFAFSGFLDSCSFVTSACRDCERCKHGETETGKDAPKREELLEWTREANRLIDDGNATAKRGWRMLEELDGQIVAAGYSPVELVSEALETLCPQDTDDTDDNE